MVSGVVFLSSPATRQALSKPSSSPRQALAKPSSPFLPPPGAHFGAPESQIYSFKADFQLILRILYFLMFFLPIFEEIVTDLLPSEPRFLQYLTVFLMVFQLFSKSLPRRFLDPF